MFTPLRCFLTSTAVTLAVSSAMAQSLSAPQVEAIATFWDLAYDCADGSGACDDIAAAVRDMNRLGICPDENRLADCASIGGESGAVEYSERAPPTAMVAVTLPDAPTGLATINPEWHAAIAAGQYLTETGFGSCARANSNPETVPFDAGTVEAEFMKLSADRHRFLQAMISAGGADGNFGPRTSTALRATAKLLEDLTARDPRPEVFDLSSVEGVQAYLDFLQEPLTEAMIWGGR